MKPLIYLKKGYWRITRWDHDKKTLRSYQRAGDYVSRLNESLASDRLRASLVKDDLYEHKILEVDNDIERRHDA